MYYHFLKNLFKIKIKSLCIFLGSWCMQKFSNDIVKEVDAYTLPLRKELSGLKTLVTICSLEYFLAVQDGFTLVKTPKCTFLCRGSDFCMPLYSEQAIDILENIFEIPVKIQEDMVLHLKSMGQGTIKKMLDVYGKQL